MKRLLAIDKDIDTLNLINFYASEFELEVYSSIDLLTAWEIEALQPDILFIDWAFNCSDGKDICAELKLNGRNKELRIALMSSIPQFKSLLRQQCADHYLHKPLDGQAIEYTLRCIIN